MNIIGLYHAFAVEADMFLSILLLQIQWAKHITALSLLLGVKSPCRYVSPICLKTLLLVLQLIFLMHYMLLGNTQLLYSDQKNKITFNMLDNCYIIMFCSIPRFLKSNERNCA